MKKDVSIRPLFDESDARTIAGWFHEFWGNIPPCLTLEQEYGYLEKSFQKQLTKLPLSLVYYLDGKPIGIICVSKEEMHSGRSDLTPWINSTFVSESMRGKKVGSALLDELHRTLKGLGFGQVYVATREVAKFYQKNGYEFLKAEQKCGMKFDILKRNF
ncbi:MAG: GNAT family N-acetyltransferase [Bdellovibrionales bacterium]|jgi:predicted N-acetyltransferase YhbS